MPRDDFRQRFGKRASDRLVRDVAAPAFWRFDYEPARDEAVDRADHHEGIAAGGRVHGGRDLGQEPGAEARVDVASDVLERQRAECQPRRPPVVRERCQQPLVGPLPRRPLTDGARADDEQLGGNVTLR